MDLSQASIFIPLIAAGSYAVLLVSLVIRLGWQERQVRWLLAFIAAAILWQLTVLPLPFTEQLINLPEKILLLNTFLLGMATAAYIDWNRRSLWFLLAGLVFLLAVVIDFFLPIPLLDQPSFTNLYPSVGGLAIPPLWLALNLVILLTTWRSYRQAQLPLHANRLLYWAIVLLVTLIGEAILFFNQPAFLIAGQIIRFAGLLGFVNAVSSHRIFDVRTRLRRLFAFSIVALVSGSLATGIIVLIQQLTSQLPFTFSTIIIVVAIAAGFLIYQPFNRIVERF
jgi:hypothetical protein